MNHPGYIGKHGQIVKPRTTRSKTLPPPYVPDVNNGAGAGDTGPGWMNGGISEMGW